MIRPDKILVVLNIEGSKIQVGEIIARNKKNYFKYDQEFAKGHLNISPIKLPLSNDIFTADPTPFDHLFGAFADSIPDGWGRLLLDQQLTKMGVLLEDVSALQRLALVGKHGMGALDYEPVIENVESKSNHVSLDKLNDEVTTILAGKASKVIDEMFDLGGSSGGARPKILVAYHPKKNHILSSNAELPLGYEHWIIKFNSSADRKDAAQIEYAYSKMAKAAGLTMAPCKLFLSEKGNHFFGTKRFDRTVGGKLHMQSAAALLNDNFRMSTMDYGHLMDAAFKLEQSIIGYEKIIRICAFNVFSHNRDDHSKNFSFLMNSKGEWQFAPSYDLTFSTSSHGHQSTSINGQSQNPTEEDILALAKHFRVKKANQILEEVREAIQGWPSIAKNAGVSQRTADLIGRKIVK